MGLNLLPVVQLVLCYQTHLITCLVKFKRRECSSKVLLVKSQKISIFNFSGADKVSQVPTVFTAATKKTLIGRVQHSPILKQGSCQSCDIKRRNVLMLAMSLKLAL